MDDQLLYLRRAHGDVFVTKLPTGQTIPWRPLTISEYLEYNRLFQMGQYPAAAIEDEIFIKCVLDKVLVDSIDKLKAGIAATVSSNIMSCSGPSSVDELAHAIDLKRVEIDDAMHDMVGVICQAFPAYKPEEVYAMDYNTMMLRVAQSERKLINGGFMQEPLNFYSKDQAGQQQDDAARQKQLEANQNMINKYYEQEGIKIPESVKRAKADHRERIMDHPVPPPIPQAGLEDTVITKSDMMEHDASLSGHDQDIVNKIRSTNDTALIYTDYLEQMKDGGKLKIQTPEERKAAAEARAEANKQKVLERRKQALEEAKAELPQLLKVREEARNRKKGKAARRRK